MLEIVEYPNKILRQKSRKVKDVLNPEIQQLIFELTETMKKADGIGLAAPQIGKNWRILAVNSKDGSLVIINPRIVWRSFFKKSAFEEGCLSFPGIFGLVKRSKWVKLRYLDKDGRLQKLKAEGLLATVLQHEIDHLKGVLFIDRIIKYSKGQSRAEGLMEQAKFEER